MTRDQAKLLAPIFQAYADGKTIQVFHSGVWNDDETPFLDFRNLYIFFDDPKQHWRIKPEPRRIIVQFSRTGNIHFAVIKGTVDPEFIDPVEFVEVVK